MRSYALTMVLVMASACLDEVHAASFQGLGFLPGDSSSMAFDVSPDGSAVVGGSTGTVTEAYRWTADGGMIGLGHLPDHEDTSWGYGVSADGEVVVGMCGHGGTYANAFRWTAETGVFRLGTPSGYVSTRATAVSADGSVIVGWGETCHGEDDDCDPDTRVARSFFWTEDEGFVNLGAPPAHYSDHVYAHAASADASIIVGGIESPLGLGRAGAFVWDADHGVRYLEDVLTADFGLDLAGWELVKATGISDDGRVIVGYGYNPSGVTEACRAVVPEPSSLVLLSMGASVLLASVGRKRRVRQGVQVADVGVEPTGQ